MGLITLVFDCNGVSLYCGSLYWGLTEWVMFQVLSSELVPQQLQTAMSDYLQHTVTVDELNQKVWRHHYLFLLYPSQLPWEFSEIAEGLLRGIFYCSRLRVPRAISSSAVKEIFVFWENSVNLSLFSVIITQSKEFSTHLVSQFLSDQGNLSFWTGSIGPVVPFWPFTV